MLIGMAPPKQGVPIQVRIPEDLLAAIDRRRAGTRLSRSETIRRMLTWAMQQPTKRELLEFSRAVTAVDREDV